MKKALYLLLVFLFFQTHCISQNIKELEKLKSNIEYQKIDLQNQVKLLDKKIDSLKLLIEFENLKEQAVKTSLRKDSDFYVRPSEFSDISSQILKKSEVLVVEYYEYARFYKVIFNNKVGYIKEKNIRITQGLKDLKRFGKTNSNYFKSSPEKNYPSKIKSTRSYSTRSYIRGPRGGCYYINSNGNKTYVARGLCN